MAGTPKMQEHFSAGAPTAAIPKNEALLLTILGVYAENAGAFFGGCVNGAVPKNEALLLTIDGVYAENAGFSQAVSGW